MSSYITHWAAQALASAGGNPYLALAELMDGVCAAAPGQQCQTAAAVALSLPDVAGPPMTDAAGQQCADVGAWLPVACYQWTGTSFAANPIAVSAAQTIALRPRGSADNLDGARPTLPFGSPNPAAVPEASALALALLGVALVAVSRKWLR